MDKPERDGQQRRSPYVKPELRRVDLKPQEAVLGFCKTSGIAGPLQGDCTIPSACSSTGS